jgi:hypothetical protein
MIGTIAIDRYLTDVAVVCTSVKKPKAFKKINCIV